MEKEDCAIRSGFIKLTKVSSVSSFHIPWNMNESNRCFIPLKKEFPILG